MKKLITLLALGAALACAQITTIPPAGGSGGGGTCSVLGGDLSGTCTAATVLKINGVTPAITPVLAGSAAVNLASAIADGACTTGTFTLTGALVTDYPSAPIRPSGLAAGLMLHAWVSASNTITIQVCNLSGSAQTPGSLTYGIALSR